VGKVIKQGDRPEFFAQGGSTKMYGKGYASPKDPDYSGKQSQGSNVGQTPEKPYEHESYTDGVKYAEGGSGKMFSKGHAGKKVPGISGKATQEG
jgi:hypothetical protein